MNTILNALKFHHYGIVFLKAILRLLWHLFISKINNHLPENFINTEKCMTQKYSKRAVFLQEMRLAKRHPFKKFVAKFDLFPHLILSSFQYNWEHLHCPALPCWVLICHASYISQLWISEIKGLRIAGFLLKKYIQETHMKIQPIQFCAVLSDTSGISWG